VVTFDRESCLLYKQELDRQPTSATWGARCGEFARRVLRGETGPRGLSSRPVSIGYLTGVLFNNRLDEVHSHQPNLISSLKIDQEGNNTLHVTAYNPFMEIEAETTLTHDKADFECTREGVKLSESLTYFWFFSALYGRGQHVLSKTEEGSLVVKTEGWLGAYHAFIPFGGHNLFWNKFDPCCASEYVRKATERYRDACRRINGTVSYARCLQHFKP
jgi:hypothetical protein